MTNTNLLEIIRAFPAKEQQEIPLFLASRHFNRGKNATEIERLYEVILDASPEFSASILTKERVYSALFSDKTPVPGKLEKVVADLNKLLKSYALQKQYFSEKNQDAQQIDWAKWLRKHGLAEDSRKVVLKLSTKKAAEEELESLDMYALNLKISEEQHLWESTYNRLKGDLNIPDLIKQLDLHYHNYRTELANRYMAHQMSTQLPELDFSASNAEVYLQESTHLQITRKIFTFLRKGLPSAEEIQSLMQDLRIHENKLSFQTLEHFNAYLRNFCTLSLNSGLHEFVAITHELNKENLERGFLFLNGKLSPNTYLNIVQVAIRAKDIEWAKGFTENYKNRLLSDGEDAFFYLFNLAHCLFAEQKFEEALDSLPEASSTSHYHHMVRRLELKIYYELDSELLTYKIDAFRKFIVRTATKTISPALQKMDLNFLNILTQIVQTPKKDKARAARLKSRIDEKKLLADRAWLIEKVLKLG